jgi:prepilin-type N-terminal cleavage/methylation domain-containing protein
VSPRARPHLQRGFTFVEMLASITILAIVGLLSVQTLKMTSRASASTVFQSELDQRAHRVVDRVVRDLQEARLDSLLPQPVEPYGASSLTYRCAEVQDVQRIDWGPNRRLELLPSPGDPRDGRDNDHDGLVDEQELWLVYDVGLPDERRTVLARNVACLLEGETANAVDDNGNGLVDEPGFCIVLRDGVLHVYLSLQARDGAGRVATRTVETTVWARN